MRSVLGKPGLFVYELIRENQVPITTIVALYGLILAIASYNYRKVIPNLTESFVKNKVILLRENKSIPVKKLSSEIYSEWIKMIDNLPKYYFIPNKNNVWIVFPDGKKFAERLNITELYIKNIIDNMNEAGEVL